MSVPGSIMVVLMMHMFSASSAQAAPQACPSGWTQLGRKGDDVPGWGLVSSGNTATSQANCQQQCNDLSTCGSFEYRSSDKKCGLNSWDKSTTGAQTTKWGDSVTCSKPKAATPCGKGLLKDNLCWVWSSGKSTLGSPKNGWRAPTANEWTSRPSWDKLQDYCENDYFGGSACDVVHAKKHGTACFCRAKGDCGGGSVYCDLMYVRSPQAAATPAPTSAPERCAWGNKTEGSIQGRNAAYHSGKTLEECKAACNADTACKSIDHNSATKDCFLGNCRIGSECKNSGDKAYTYIACGAEPHWLDISSLENTKVSQESTGHGGDAARAVDGNAASSWNSRSVTHTHTRNNPWWKIDMGENFDITDLRVTNRGDCCGDRLNGFNAFIDDKECAKNVKINQGQTVEIGCVGNGRVVKIQVPRRTPLSLAEVGIGVNALTTTITTTIAPNWLTPSESWKTSQSSTAHGGDSKRAIDGNSASSWHSRSVTHTRDDTPSWWQVDLQTQVNMSVVSVTNRGDCCGGHLNGFNLLVGNSKDTMKECASKVSINQGQTKVVKCQASGSIVKILIPGRNHVMLAEVRVGLPGKPVVPLDPAFTTTTTTPAPVTSSPSTACTKPATNNGVCSKGTMKFSTKVASEADCKAKCDAGRAMAKEGGLKEEVYSFRQNGQFHDLSKKAPKITRRVNNIDYSNHRSALEGHIGQRDHFYVHWSGGIKIKTAGTYTFYTESDDGSRLFLNGAQVVDNPGWHGMRRKEGKEVLEAGKHEFWAEMFEGGGGAGMKVYYSGPDTGNSRIVIPQTAYAPPASAAGGAGGMVIVAEAWQSGICKAYSYGSGGDCLLYTKCDSVSDGLSEGDEDLAVCGDKSISGNSGGWFGNPLSGFKTCEYDTEEISSGGNTTSVVTKVGEAKA